LLKRESSLRIIGVLQEEETYNIELNSVSYIANNICKILGELREFDNLKIRELVFRLHSNLTFLLKSFFNH